MAHHFGDNVHTKSFTPREYQVELLDAAKERNIIVCLGTESGKSFIAMKLIQEMANDTRRTFGRRRDGGCGGKRTLYLVEHKSKSKKVSLGLRNLTDLTVSNIWQKESTSADWSDECWMQEIQSNQVLVMGSKACHSILKRGVLSLKYVNLLILDECHRAIKGHLYTKIMSDFYRKLPKKKQPRILGLTAPLLLLLGCPVPEGDESKKAPHPGCLEARLEKLEKTLDCTAETASDIVSLLRYCPRPRELVVEWSLAKKIDPVGIALSKCIEDELTAAWTFLKDHRYDPMEIYQDAEFAEELSGIPDPKNDPIAVLKDFLHILRTLGPWCADRAALLLLIHLDKLKVKTPYERHFLLLCMVTTIMVKIRGICDLTFQEYKECERIYKFSTPKVLRFLDILRVFLPPVTVENKENIQVSNGPENSKAETASNEKQNDNEDAINIQIKCQSKEENAENMSLSSENLVSNVLDEVSNVKGELNNQNNGNLEKDDNLDGLNKNSSKECCKCIKSVPFGSLEENLVNLGSTSVEEVPSAEKNCTCDPKHDSPAKVQNLVNTEETDIPASNLVKEHLNVAVNTLNDKEVTSHIGSDKTGFLSKESSIWDRGGRSRRWGGNRGRGRGGRGGGRGQGHSNWNRNGPDLPVSDSLCGIVFVDGRFTAKILYHLLNDLRRSDPQFASLAAQYTVGCSMPVAGDNNSALDPREAEAEYRKQEEVLKRFRTHECNLLIGPTGWALEDGGLELPRCNLVVRFDHESISTELISLPVKQTNAQTLFDGNNKIMENGCKPQLLAIMDSQLLTVINIQDTCNEAEKSTEDEAVKTDQEDPSTSIKLNDVNLNNDSIEISSEIKMKEDDADKKSDLTKQKLSNGDSDTIVPVPNNVELICKTLTSELLENQQDPKILVELDNVVDAEDFEGKKETSENGSLDNKIVSVVQSNAMETSNRRKKDDLSYQLDECIITRTPVSYHSYARSRARARAPDAHHIIMAAEGEEAGRVVNSLAHFMQIEEMLLRRCKNREPPEEEEVEADGIALQGEVYCPASLKSNVSTSNKVPCWNNQARGNHFVAKDEAKGEKACVTLATAIALVNRYCAKLPSDTFTRLTPLWSLKEIKGVDGNCSYICALRLPINSPVKQDIMGHPMPTRALARRSAALEACKVLHQARELDDDLMPVGKESFRAEVESEEEEEEEEEEEDEEDLEESVKSEKVDAGGPKTNGKEGSSSVQNLKDENVEEEETSKNCDSNKEIEVEMEKGPSEEAKKEIEMKKETLEEREEKIEKEKEASEEKEKKIEKEKETSEDAENKFEREKEISEDTENKFEKEKETSEEIEKKIEKEKESSEEIETKIEKEKETSEETEKKIEKEKETSEEKEKKIEKEKETSEETEKKIEKEKETSEETEKKIEKEKETSAETEIKIEKEKETSVETETKIEKEKELSEEAEKKIEDEMEKETPEEAEKISGRFNGSENNFDETKKGLYTKDHKDHEGENSVIKEKVIKHTHAENDRKGFIINADNKEDNKLYEDKLSKTEVRIEFKQDIIPLPYVKENKTSLNCLDIDSKVNSLTEFKEDIIPLPCIKENKTSLNCLDMDNVKAHLGNNIDYINDMDKSNLIEHAYDKKLVSHCKKVVGNGLIKCNNYKYNTKENLKVMEQILEKDKDKIEVMDVQPIKEEKDELVTVKESKETGESEAKVVETKDRKQKTRKKQEEEDLEEEGEEEVVGTDGMMGNCSLDRPRPGTTKRRQYYYKRTADALTDCRPLPMHPAYLYNLGMKLACPLPDEQNTRGRRIHPPEDSPRGFGILTLKEIPKICPFPIFTRSGEVRVCLEPCTSPSLENSNTECKLLDHFTPENSKNNLKVSTNNFKGFLLPDPQQILLTEEQLSKALAFLNYTFAGVLRLQRYLMAFDPVASENSYLIVPTMTRKGTSKDGEDKKENNTGQECVEVDWEFVDLIYGCKGESKPVPVSEEDRKSYEFDASLYHDAVVMPWYRNQDQPQYFYVAEICTHLSPKSSFPGSEYRTFEEYYFKKYVIQICNREQPLLDVDHTSARLNFLTPRYVNRKGVALPTSSEETKRAKRESLEQKQILVPELCSRHPFPASLWRKAVCLPCILYRLNALLLADQLRARVAKEIGLGLEKVPIDFDWPPLDFGWSLADVLKKSKETENQTLDSKKGVKSGKDQADNEREDKSSNEEKDPVEGEERKGSKKKGGLKRRKKKKKNGSEDSLSGEEKSDDDDGDDDSDKEEEGNWMEIGTWSNEMAAETGMGHIPPLPDNVTMVGDGGKEGWGTAVLGSAASGAEERIRYGSPSIWKGGSSGPVEVFRGLEHDLEGLETSDSSDDDDDDAREEDDDIEEAVLIPEEEVEDRGHHPRGKLRIQFKSDFLAEAVEVLDDDVDEGTLLKVLTEAGEAEEEDEEDEGVAEEEDTSWFWEEDETEEKYAMEQYVTRFENAVLKNRKMIENSGMLLHSEEGFSIGSKAERSSMETKQMVQIACDHHILKMMCHVETFREMDKSESNMTTTEDCDFMSLDSLSDDDEDIFLDVSCENVQPVEDSREDVLLMEEFSEDSSRQETSCSSRSSLCSCCSSCGSCSSPICSSEDDNPWEEDFFRDVSSKITGTDNHLGSAESNQSFSFDAQPPLDGHPGPSPPLLLQALTMSNANDGINLERLETIGDSFLKYAITAYLYCTHHSIHEGKLSHLRSKQVSNVNLYRLGRRKHLGESMIAAKFEPHDNWLPPCYHVPLHLERALIRAGLPPSHWNGAEVPSLASLSPAQIGRVVREKGRRIMMKTIAEQELSLQSLGKNTNDVGFRSVRFEGHLDNSSDKSAKMDRVNSYGRYDLNFQGSGRPTSWDHGSRRRVMDHANFHNGNSAADGTHSKDTVTSSDGNRVEELPCFVPYNLVTQQSIPDKSVADCVEALIGAYLIACGPRGALLFMAWLGIRVLPSQKIVIDNPKDSLLNEEGKRPVGCMLPKEIAGQKGEYYQVSYGALSAPPPPLALSSCSHANVDEDRKAKKETKYRSGIYCKHCLRAKRVKDGDVVPSDKICIEKEGKKNSEMERMDEMENKERCVDANGFEVRPAVQKELRNLLGGLNEFEKHIGYYFQDRSLLLQALTHASYSPNRLTDCYQRLEFLGDAVLDYLITRHLYEDPRQHSPGALTDLRSALVNNTIFASLAVRHGFHRFFLHLSPGLHSVVERFVRMQAGNGHAICEEYYLIEEEECEEAEDVEVPKALGDVFESVAGAIFLDSGMSLDAVWTVYYRMMKAEIEQFSTNVPKSPIRELLEMEPETAKFGKPEKLADGRRVRVTVEVFGKGTFKGIGRNYRIAKCTAAKCALRQLKKRGLLFPRKN